MDRNAPLISVIIPVYRVEQYIHQCVDSVLSQTYGKTEVILVDDGSPDCCGAICDEYARQDDRVRVVHKENGGLVSARKAGAAACTGDYVFCLDSDDYIDTTLLERCVAVIAACAPDIIAINYTRFSSAGQNVVKNEIKPGLYTGGDLKQVRDVLVLDKNRRMPVIPGLAVKLIRRELYLPQQMKIPEAIQNGEDMAVTAPLMARCDSIYFLDCAGYYYRDNQVSLSNTFSPKRCAQLRLLVPFLAKELGEAYRENLDRYTEFCVSRFLDLAASSAGSFREYQHCIRDLRTKELRVRTKRAVLNRDNMTFRTRLLSVLKKNGLYTLFWMLVSGWNFLKNGRSKK